jgi:biotin operon repressor
MPPNQPRYTATREDLARVDRVHRLITTHPTHFAATGARLDEVYAPQACLDRILNNLPFKRDDGEAAGKSWTDRADAAAKQAEKLRGAPGFGEACKAEMEFRENAMAYHIPTLSEFAPRSKRLSEAVSDLLADDLDVSVPRPSWEWAGHVLIVYWLLSDPRSEQGEIVTDFQRWPWVSTPGSPGRELAQWAVPDAVRLRLHAAVDIALGVAEMEGLVPVVRNNAELGLGLSEQKVLKALREDQRIGQSRTAKVIGGGLGLSEDAVNRAVKKLSKHGWRISNPRGGKGYSLDAEPGP